MVVQLALGSLLIVLTAMASGAAVWLLEAWLMPLRGWLRRPPLRRKLALTLGLAMVWAVLVMTLGVWIWAVAFHLLDVFEDFETALYFALVAFTTLGFGDLLLPPEWRLLAGLSAAAGLLNFGLLTAILVDALRLTRQHQRGDPP
ncbi:two pore domain potassium channel family protein [Rhodobacteraceae bacterium CCMM004]|nr:two pore domain potassium channel family protein [Rhodobacteraceae bacterium CCMM004]